MQSVKKKKRRKREMKKVESKLGRRSRGSTIKRLLHVETCF